MADVFEARPAALPADRLTPDEVEALRALLYARDDVAPTIVVNEPGWVPTVAAGEVIASVWGNAIRDRVVHRFASVADRDTSWPAPPNGAHCVTVDTGTLWQRGTSAWFAIRPSQAVTETSNVLGGTNVAGTEVVLGSITLAAASWPRQVLPMCRAMPNESDPARVWQCRLYEAGAVIGGARAAGGTSLTIVGPWRSLAANVAVTYDVRAMVTAGTGVISFPGDPTWNRIYALAFN